MTPIIFVWLGKSLPKFSLQSLLFAKKSNPRREVCFCLDNEPSVQARAFLEKSGVKLLVLGKVKNIDASGLDPEKLQFRGDLWVNTSLRFFYLKYLCRLLGLVKFFHAELDNAVFNLDGLDEKLDQCGHGLFVPRDASDRALASLIYCNRAESLSELIGLYSRATPPKHDMDALGMYSREYSNHFFSLSTESYAENREFWRMLEPAFLGGLFDAAAIGQYTLGVDPIHRKGRPSYNGFINENSKINWGGAVFDADGKNLFLSSSAKAADKYRLFNLHIHAKNWSAFDSLLGNGRILKRLQEGKRSIISGRIFVFFGWAYAPLLRVKGAAKKLLRYSNY